jgi:polysaccharide chain length determinant protein (PEP-CTERM system associated)
MESGSKLKINVILKEILNHRYFVILVFAFVTVSAVMVGMNWPKRFTSSTTIFVEEENILGPLMAGAAVQTEVIDRAAIAREIIYGYHIMYQLIKEEGLVEKHPNPAVQERLMNEIRSKLTISSVRNNLIKIEYSDADPDRTYRITNSVAQLFIEESLADKAKQSTEAFEFIDQQAQEYKVKLQQAEQDLKLFRSENVDAQPGMSGDIGRRITELQTRKEQIVQELKEARIRKASLEKQLSGEAIASSAFSRTEQHKARIAELQTQLDALRLKFHDTYPDIQHVKDQIQELREAIRRSEETASRENVDVIIDERVLSNPVYQQLQSDLYDTKTTIETLNSRLEQTNAAIATQLERARKVEEYEAKLQELTRDYEVNNESYSDLMRRREQARVSMNLDIERKGLTLRIDEAAYRPHSPSGIRFMHFLLAGPLIGLAIPIGILFLMVQLDPRVRTDSTIFDDIGIPVLGKTPHMASPREITKNLAGVVGLSLVVVGTIAFLITVATMRMQGTL